MDTALLLAITTTNRTSAARARAALEGDATALNPLYDCLLEEDVTHSAQIGKDYYIETVTHYWGGEARRHRPGRTRHRRRLQSLRHGSVSDFLKTGKPKECEPVPDGLFWRIPRACVTGIGDWPHKLLREQI